MNAKRNLVGLAILIGGGLFFCSAVARGETPRDSGSMSMEVAEPSASDPINSTPALIARWWAFPTELKMPEFRRQGLDSVNENWVDVNPLMIARVAGIA